jgi:cytochrome c1
MARVGHGILGLVAVAAVGFGLATTAQAAADAAQPPAQKWSFDGIFGSFDRAATQRGLQVFLEVCGNCHGLDLVAYRNLAEIGYDEDQVKAIAAQFSVEDGPDEEGEMFTREARPSDAFVSPYRNAKEAAMINGGALPPDLSLMYKARMGGADYMYALLIGYEEDTGDHGVPEGLFYNPYFPGGATAMPPPLYGDDVEYADGTEATIEQESKDVTVFLAWAAEPNLDARKRLGTKVLLFLIVLTALLYATKRKVWRDLH